MSYLELGEILSCRSINGENHSHAAVAKETRSVRIDWPTSCMGYYLT